MKPAPWRTSRIPRRWQALAVAMAGAAWMAGPSASSSSSAAAAAAVLTGSVSTSSPANVNLTGEGTTDWAIWDYRLSTTGSSGAPSNRKSGGTTGIGAVSALLGTPRGITGTSSPPTYTYTDGTPTTSATNAAIGAITDTSINTVGSGWTTTLTGDPAAPEVVRFYVDGFDAVGTFTATLNGATAYTDSTVSYGGTRSGAVYTLTFQPDSAADTLQVSCAIKSLNSGGNANVDLQAVTVAPAPLPEPGAVMGLACVGGAAILRRRRG